MNGKSDLKLSILMNRFMQKIMMLDRQEKMCQGVTLSQHYVIDTLHRKKVLTMNELSQELGLAVRTLTRIIDVLVRDEIVSRNHSAQDRRKVCIELTEKGKKLAENLKTCAEYFWNAVLKTIPDEKKKAIAEDLKILLSALEQAGDTHCPRFRREKRTDK
jgi:DNA-binding MarR family transcriptional regulator